jgi:SpoVK/Ycf46/Vps4 family AAA+-type ATPase
MDFQPYSNDKNIVETEFELIPYGHSLWNTLFEYKKKLLGKQNGNILKINKNNKIELYPIHKLNEPIFNKIAQDLKTMTLKAFKPSPHEKLDNVSEISVDKKKNKLTIVKKDTEEDEESQVPQEEEIEFLIIEPDPKDSLESIILHPQTKIAIEQALIKMEFKNILQKDWAPAVMNKKNLNNCFLNFFGPPGTGKTVSVKALASIVQKPIVQVDFSALLSKWVGGTGKNIKKYFDKAKEIDGILFFDEADTLLHSRSSSGSGGEQHNIQNQNIFMQEMDRYEGILVTTTNHFENFDEAQIRRFTHIEFLLPNLEMREKIIANHLPLNVKLEKGLLLSDIAKETEGFSGGDISNLIEQVLLNQIFNIKKNHLNQKTEEVALIIKNSTFTFTTFQEEIKKIINSKNSHKGINKNTAPIRLV